VLQYIVKTCCAARRKGHPRHPNDARGEPSPWSPRKLLQWVRVKPAGTGELGFDIQGVEAFLPLSPKCALYMPCLSISEQIISGYENAVSIHRGLRSAALRGPTIASLHSGLLHLSQRVMRQSYPLYQSLTTGAALTALSENVDNLNYLQCVFAHMAVYSNRRDFAFAKRVLHESPQYRTTPKAGLAMVEGPAVCRASPA
jgi:hypothetical protein